MTITITGNFVLDQTAGLQTPTDGNDVAVGMLPSAFSTRLFTGLSLSNAFPTMVGVGKSADNFITVSAAGTITALSLLDSGGGALNGDPSGVFALNGNQIFFYADSMNPNIVLGRVGSDATTADPAGAIALALYLEPTNAALTQARMWSVTFQPLQNNLNGLDPDDRIDFGNNLKVGATSVTNFSFANAPSGDNLFMAFGSTSSAIVVTGLNPNNNNTGSDLNKAGGFSTVNSGQGGGGTTLGTGIQGIDINQGMIFTYVTGMNASFLASAAAGGLDQNEADSEQNIAFTGLNPGTGASFKVVKVSKNVTADVQIKALSTALQSGTQYVDGLSDDTTVTITSVTVNGVNKSFTTNADGSVTVTGINQDDVIAFTTSAQHNRVQIVNASGPGGPNFSLGAFGLSNTANDTATIGDRVDFDDDGPSAALAATMNRAITDESTPPPNTDGGFAEPNDNTGKVPAIVPAAAALIGHAQATVVSTAGTTFGTDGGAAALSLSLSSQGVDSNLDTTDGTSIFLFKEGAVVVGRAGADAMAAATGEAIFALSLSNAGVLTVEQYDSVKHLTTAHDELAQIGSGKLFAVNTATDNDNDPSTAQVDLAQRFGFEDDGPSASLALNAGVFVTVDESVGTDMADPNAADETAMGAPVGAIGYAVVAGATLFNAMSAVGEDEEGAASVYSLVVNGAGATGLTTTSGAAISLVSVNSTTVEGRYSGGSVAFSVSINSSNGAVTLTQFTGLDQPTNPLTYDEAVQIASGALTARLTVTDGDTDVATANVDLGPRLSFEDDGPKLAIDPASTDMGALNVGNTLNAMDMETFSFDAGSDGSGGFCITDAPDTGGYGFRYVNAMGQTVTGPTNSIVGTLNGTDLYSLSVNASGKYTFTLLSTLPGAQVDLDVDNIKAGGPNTNFIDVGAVGSSSTFIKLSGFGVKDDPTKINQPAPINESNGNVGVNTGNLDPQERIVFQLYTDADNNPMTAQTVTDFTSITIGTKAPAGQTVNFSAYDNGVLKYSGTALTQGVNGSFVVNQGNTLIDEVRVTVAGGSAIKIGLDNTFINILPEDQTLDFTAILKDGDGDQTAGVNFQAFIDGNGDGMIDSLSSLLAQSRESIFLSAPLGGGGQGFDIAAASGGHYNGDLSLYHLV